MFTLLMNVIFHARGLLGFETFFYTSLCARGGGGKCTVAASVGGGLKKLAASASCLSNFVKTQAIIKGASMPDLQVKLDFS